MTEGADRRDVVAHGLQAFADPARDFGAAGVGEAGELGEVGDRHDAGQDGDVDAPGRAAIDEAKVGIRVIEILGDGTVGASLDLALEVGQVLIGIGGLGMDLGVGRHLDAEMVAGLLTDEGDQFVGVAEVPSGAQPHAGGQVAAQGHQAADALTLVTAQDGLDLGPGGADAGQVRGGRDASGQEQVQGLEGAVPGGAAGPVGDREVLRPHGIHQVDAGGEFGHPLRGLGREQFETEGGWVGTGGCQRAPVRGPDGVASGRAGDINHTSMY